LSGGVYLLNKPRGFSSRRAASRVAHSWSYEKWGHCGTLDPEASGVLPVLLGRATRLSQYLTGGTKVYSFTLVMGVTTESNDMESPVLQTRDATGVSREMVISALERLTGTIEQTVPLYSAVRINGKRAFKFARSGETPVMPTRTVCVRNWSLGDVEECLVRLRVEVSQGTYVRALARDAGELLGVGGVATDIVREESAGFSLRECSSDYSSSNAMLTMAQALRAYPWHHLSPPDVSRVLHGLSVDGDMAGDVALVAGDGRLIAMGRGENGVVKPVRVLEKP